MGILREHALAAGDFPVQTVAAIRRQLTTVREPRAGEVAQRVVLVFKRPAVVLLAYQLARRVAGEDEYGIPFRLPLFQQRIAPLGAGGAADFQRQRVVTVLGVVAGAL
ncbi:hypothetical protein ACTV70_004583 [Cronobacter dublinensis]